MARRYLTVKELQRLRGMVRTGFETAVCVPKMVFLELVDMADECARDRERLGTHADGCWAWGSGHYGCAIAEIERLGKDSE